VGSVLVGFLEARRRFPTLGLIRLVTGALNYAAPLAVAIATRSLAAAVAAVVIVRLLMTTALLCAAVISTPALRGRPVFDYRTLAPMLGYGAWLTVSNFIAPAILYADRFIIGAFLPVVWLAYYATPQDIVTRLWIVPGAFASVLFPKFVAGDDRVSPASDLLRTGLAWVSLAIFPPVLLLCAFSMQLLALWTGDDFAQKSGLVLAWFAVGVLVNSGAQVIATFVQARGHADFTAKLYIVEFPLYCGLLFWLVPQFGIAGAAYAWVARIVFDAMALLAFSVWLMPAMRALVPGLVIAAAVAISVCAVAYATQSLAAKGGIFAVSLLGVAAFAWKRGGARDVPWRRIGDR
jgi:O-antigen/teichoic acid export membrane protein